jgi:hypothetical protein
MDDIQLRVALDAHIWQSKTAPSNSKRPLLHCCDWLEDLAQGVQPVSVGAVTSRSFRVAPVGSLCCGFGRLWCDLLFAVGVPIAVVVQQSAFLLSLLLFVCSAVLFALHCCLLHKGRAAAGLA